MLFLSLSCMTCTKREKKCRKLYHVKLLIS
ncbi:unnamed protein product [Spirodela intermedia]|uniref:Uncharacterized protein n=1 Tax=Spirodela intermedia TaxID=51605 RepID=A0A7I8L3R5_SPIIN|nr:unnamed protein product [Spirodela intermedia]